MTLFSICVPTYEMSGYGHEMLKELFENLKLQTVQDFEIVVSDQSQDDKTLRVCEEYSDTFTIKYIRNFYGKGKSAHNLNTCLDACVGKIVKIIFEDDYFVDNDALKKISKKFEQTNYKWIMTAFTHTQDTKTYFNPIIPRMNDNLLEGVNTMGNPSCLAFLRSHKQYFDEDILYIVDCELYYRLHLLYGDPGIIEDILVALRYHESSATLDPKFISKKSAEINYCANKYLQLS